MLIGYARTSTVEQRLDLQVDALRAAGCTKIFTDQISGKAQQRPGLDDALSHLRDGDTLVVWRLDRLGRNTRHLLALIDDLRERGVTFRSLTEGIDTTGTFGDFLYKLFAAFSELERNLIRDRTRAGLDAAKRRGRLPGRRKVLSPTDLVTAKDLIDAGNLSMTEIANRLGVAKSTLYRAVPGGRSNS